VIFALVLALAATAGTSGAPQQALRVHLRLEGGPEGSRAERDRVRDLEYELMARLADGAAGAFVRDEWNAGTCVLHFEGKDASAIWAIIEPPLRAYDPRPGSYAVLRHGGPGAREERVDLAQPRR
jgi:hypothetical protein